MEINTLHVYFLYAEGIQRQLRTLLENIKFICTFFRNKKKNKLFCPISQRVQIDYIFSDNVRILYLSYNGEKLRE